VSSEGIYPAPYAPPVNGGARKWRALRALQRRRHYWVHGLLFLLTFLTTTVVGARMAQDFAADRPLFAGAGELALLQRAVQEPSLLLAGLPFSATLMMILLAHELGHLLTCVHYRIDATLPYFLPAPTLIGTLGAFIRIRSPIYSRRVLFDVGIAGPLAGFLTLLPVLGIGLAFSKVIPGIAARGDIIFSTPPLLMLLEGLVFPGVPTSDIYLHPMARAAWVGLLATALNLIPIGQLDGGHVLYALAADQHKWLSRLFLLVLVPLGIFFWYGWLLWAALLFFFGMKHPSIVDTTRLDPERRRLALAGLALFLLSFSLAPIEPRFSLQ